MVQGKINRNRHTDNPDGCHSIRTSRCPPPPSPILQAGCPSCRPTNSDKALKANHLTTEVHTNLRKGRCQSVTVAICGMTLLLQWTKQRTLNIGLLIPNHVTQTSFTVNETTCCLSKSTTLLFQFNLTSYTQSLVIHHCCKFTEMGIARDPGNWVPVLSTSVNKRCGCLECVLQQNSRHVKCVFKWKNDVCHLCSRFVMCGLK